LFGKYLSKYGNSAGCEIRRIAKQHLTFASNEGAASEAGLVRKVRQQFA